MEKFMKIIHKRYISARIDAQDCYTSELETRKADGTWIYSVDPGTYYMISIIAELKEISMRKAAMALVLTCYEDITK
jgi:hypothetical protein